MFIFILFEGIYFCLFVFCFYLAGGEQEITNKDIYLALTTISDSLRQLVLLASSKEPTASGLNLFTNTSISTDNFNYNLQLPLICVDDIILLDERLKEDSSARSELVSLLFTLIYFVS